MSPSPCSKISPVSGTSSPVISIPSIDNGNCLPDSYIFSNSFRLIIFPLPTALQSCMTISKDLISVCFFKKLIGSFSKVFFFFNLAIRNYMSKNFKTVTHLKSMAQEN